MNLHDIIHFFSTAIIISITPVSYHFIRRFAK